MKKVLLLIAVILVVGQAKAQQLPQFAIRNYHQFLYNPAVTGAFPYVEINAISRNQWTGFDQAPRTQILGAHSSIDKKKYGVGGYFFNDRNGLVRHTGLQLSYAYHLPLGNRFKLGMGLSGSIGQYALNGSEITLHNATDPLLDLNQNSRTWVPDAGFGLFLYDKLGYFGVSAQHLIPNDVNVFTNVNAGASMPTVAHIYTMGKYHILLPNEDFELAPAFSTLYVPNAPFQADINASVVYMEYYAFGIGYRTQDAISIFTSLTLMETIHVRYAYDLPLSNAVGYSAGSHQIGIVYDLYYRPDYKKSRRRYNLDRVRSKDE